jgi:hypothetical protein
MAHRAIALSGTCTGEHGIGMGKKKFLTEELGENTVNLMRKIKLTFDEQQLLNPDKVLDVMTVSPYLDNNNNNNNNNNNHHHHHSSSSSCLGNHHHHHHHHHHGHKMKKTNSQ